MGGRGGKVIRVTTLKANGPGSLTEALNTPGPRIVVFEVGAVFHLGRSEVEIRELFLTVAGQTCAVARHHADPRRDRHRDARRGAAVTSASAPAKLVCTKVDIGTSTPWSTT